MFHSHITIDSYFTIFLKYHLTMVEFIKLKISLSKRVVLVFLSKLINFYFFYKLCICYSELSSLRITTEWYVLIPRLHPPSCNFNLFMHCFIMRRGCSLFCITPLLIPGINWVVEWNKFFLYVQMEPFEFIISSCIYLPFKFWYPLEDRIHTNE